MKDLRDLLVEGEKKNKKYYKGGMSFDDIQSAYKQNILNMRTVQEGTATAGAFCNRIMEIASNHGVNMVDARVISDIFQRIALDSKHDGVSGGYKKLDWFRIAELLKKVKKGVTRDYIRNELLAYLSDKATSEEEEQKAKKANNRLSSW